jgi:hypothetical protein
MTNPARQIFDQKIMPLFLESNPAWIKRARDEARYLARLNGSVCVDDIRRVCPPPEGADPRIMGSVLRAPEFIKLGLVNSERDACHGRPITRFALASDPAHSEPMLRWPIRIKPPPNPTA